MVNKIVKPLKEKIAFSTLFSFLALCIFFILLRRTTFNIPLVRDEGEYAYSAWLLRQNILPYANSFMQKPPMIIYTYALAQWINPVAYWAPRVLSYVSLALATVLLGLVARLEFGKGTGLNVMWIVTPMIILPVWQFTANTEQFMLLPLMATLVFYVWEKGQANQWHWFWTGIFSALTLLYKYQVMPMILFIFIVWSIETWQYSRRMGVLIKNVFFGALGGITASAIVLGYFLLQDGGASLWECTVKFNSYYIHIDREKIRCFILFIKLLFSSWWILFVYGALYIVYRPARWWFYTCLTLLALMGPLSGIFDHYYIVAMPFVALIASQSIDRLSGQVSNKLSVSSHWIRGAIVFVTVVLLWLPLRTWFFLSPDQTEKLLDWDLMRRPFLECPLAAKKVAELTSPDDYVYIIGEEPQILYYAKRRSPTRFIISYQLLLNTPMNSVYQREVINDFKRHPPKVMVFERTSVLWGMWKAKREDFKYLYPQKLEVFLNRLLGRKEYRLVGAFIREKNEEYWWESKNDIILDREDLFFLEPLHNYQLAKSSFLIFVRNP